MEYRVPVSGSAGPQGELCPATPFENLTHGGSSLGDAIVNPFSFGLGARAASLQAPAQAENENPVLLAALDYAARGWPVFPCSPADKAPLAAEGYKAASKDPDQIRKWWGRHPTAMIGVPTGPET